MKLSLVISPNGKSEQMFRLHKPGCADIAKTLKRDSSASETVYEAADVEGIVREASLDLYGTEGTLQPTDVVLVNCARPACRCTGCIRVVADVYLRNAPSTFGLPCLIGTISVRS